MEAARARPRAPPARGLECAVEEIWDQPPVAMAPELVGGPRRAPGAALRPVDIVAGAGHDAQLLGRASRPRWSSRSRNGGSHCPDEYASPRTARPASVLAETLRALAY